MRAMDIFNEFKKGYVYFVRIGVFGPIKIGFATNVKKRLYHLQTGCPEELRLLCSIKTNIKTEREIHFAFRDINIRGEWFHPTQKLLDYISTEIKEEEGRVYYDSDNPDQHEGMNKRQWDSWLRYKKNKEKFKWET